MERDTGTRSTCLGYTNTTKDTKDTVTATVTATLTDMSDRWDGTHLIFNKSNGSGGSSWSG